MGDGTEVVLAGMLVGALLVEALLVESVLLLLLGVVLLLEVVEADMELGLVWVFRVVGAVPDRDGDEALSVTFSVIDRDDKATSNSNERDD